MKPKNRSFLNKQNPPHQKAPVKVRLKKNLPLVLPMVFGLLVWLPVAMVAGGSLMGRTEISEKLGPVLNGAQGFASWSLLPQYPTAQPAVELMLDTPQFFVMFWNSLKLTGGILLGQLLVGVPAAWGFSQFQFKGKKLLFLLYIVLMLMPFQVTMVSNYLVLDQFSLLNSHWGIILPAVFSTFPVFIMYRFFQGIPKELLQSAQLDGANPVQIFWYIGVPLGSGGIMSAMVLSFLEYWNMVEQPLTFLKEKALWPLSLYLPSLVDEKPSLAFIASAVTLLPPLLVFLFGQKYLEQGIRSAGMKD